MDGQSWKTFLKNHTVWACDFLQLYDIWFRPVFAFFIVDVNANHTVHVAVTRAPTEQWTAQQPRETTPFGQGPQVLIRDRDTKYGSILDRVAEGADIEVVLTAPCAPRMNSVAERFLRSVRGECTGHVIILGEAHLRAILSEYVTHFNSQRSHQAADPSSQASTVLQRRWKCRGVSGIEWTSSSLSEGGVSDG